MRNSSQKYQLNIVIVLGVLLGVLMTALIAFAQPTNDEITNATEILALDFTDTLDTSEATPDGPGGCYGEPNNVWYTLMLNEDTAVRLSTDGSNYFAFVDVFESTAPGDYTHITCDSNPRFLARAGTTYYIAVSSPDGPGGTLVFKSLNLGPPPANDDISNATAITEIDFTDTRNTIGAEPDGPEGCWGGFPNVWYTLTLNEDTAVRLSTDGSDYGAFVNVFVRTEAGDYTFIDCFWGDEDRVFTASAGTTYYIAVGSPDGPGGTLVFSLVDLGAPLQITLRLDPTGRKVATGTATVSGTVTCNNPAEVDVSGQLRQKVGRRIIVGDFSTHVSCDGETPWSAIARSDQGAFGGGRAEILGGASGCDQYTCDDDSATAIIQLRGKQ
jgi:hypothetical protein